MRAKPYKQTTATAFPELHTNDIVEEALAKQAKLRPKLSPPKELAVPPTLPKVRRPLRTKLRGKRK